MKEINDPVILINVVETLIYGIHNICVEEGHPGLLIFNGDQMNKIRDFISKNLTELNDDKEEGLR